MFVAGSVVHRSVPQSGSLPCSAIDKLLIPCPLTSSTCCHLRSAGFEMEHTASCDGHAVQWCGSIPAHQLGSFVSLAYELISVHKQARTKASAKGYSCTPSMVHAVVCDAIRLMRSQPVSLLLQKLPSHSELTVPRGGYTDVGQHTGTQPRNTAWPLVSQVLRVSSKASLLAPECTQCVRQ